MDFLNSLFKLSVAGNELWRIVLLFGVILIAFVVGKLAKAFFISTAKKFEGVRPIAAISFSACSRGAVFISAAMGISFATKILLLGSKIAGVIETVSEIIVLLAIAYFAYYLIDISDVWLKGLAKKTESKLDDMIVPIVRKSLRVTLFLLVGVQIAQTLSDKPVTSIIAGLGIGGLAFALAAQDTIKNFFGSIVLFTDRPFEPGDRVMIDGFDGPVEAVGFRSTRIRTLDGHLITIPNGELANKTIQNIGKRPYIRRIANITITYDTPHDKVERATGILKDILKNHEGMHEDFPPRIYFNDFNADSLNIIVIYWYHPPDYWAYMEFTEKFNMEVFRRFGEEGIEFAFPTQTLFVAGDPARPLNIGVRNESPPKPS